MDVEIAFECLWVNLGEIDGANFRRGTKKAALRDDLVHSLCRMKWVPKNVWISILTYRCLGSTRPETLIASYWSTTSCIHIFESCIQSQLIMIVTKISLSNERNTFKPFKIIEWKNKIIDTQLSTHSCGMREKDNGRKYVLSVFLSHWTF